MNALASIIVPLLNQQDAWLHQSVESACRQSVPCEVIVVYSAKTCVSNLDVVDDLRRHYSQIVRIQERRGGYLAGAINTGISAASTSRIGLLLTDDWLELTAMERCLQYETDIVCTG